LKNVARRPLASPFQAAGRADQRQHRHPRVAEAEIASLTP